MIQGMAEDLRHPFEAAERQRSRLLGIVRTAFFVLIITVALLTVFQDPSGGDPGTVTITEVIPWWVPVLMAIVFYTIALVIDGLTPNKKIATVGGVFFGMLVGLLATIALSLVIRLVLRSYMDEAAFRNFEPVASVMEVLLGIALCFLGISTVLQTQDDFRLVIPYVEFAKQLRGPKPLVLDSSVLIDARVVGLGATGVLQVPVVIPRFVVAELQLLADSHDKIRRARGRRGLDVIARLQRMGRLDVTVDESSVPGKAVDSMLIEFARRIEGTVVTNDTGLSRVAQIEGLTVIDINEVSEALRPALIPGEPLRLHIAKCGEQPTQGIGYLEDGTMVVVDGAAGMIGQAIEVEVGKTIQTSGGRMIFARYLESGMPEDGLVGPSVPLALEREDSSIEGPTSIQSDARSLSSEPAEADLEASSDPSEVTPDVVEPDPARDRGPIGPGSRGRGTRRNPRR